MALDAISCHGQMHPTRDLRKGLQPKGWNCLLLARSLTTTSRQYLENESDRGRVVWIGGCEAGADLDLREGCEASDASLALQASPFRRQVASGHIEFFPGNMLVFQSMAGA